MHFSSQNKSINTGINSIVFHVQNTTNVLDNSTMKIEKLFSINAIYINQKEKKFLAM
jgi:hypothetical protein